MRLAMLTLVIFTLLPRAASSAAAEDYAAARAAHEGGDCAGMVEHLEKFLAAYPTLRESHFDFYLQLKIVMGQCGGGLHVSGSGADATAIDPLPELPPLED